MPQESESTQVLFRLYLKKHLQKNYAYQTFNLKHGGILAIFIKSIMTYLSHFLIEAMLMS